MIVALFGLLLLQLVLSALSFRSGIAFRRFFREYRPAEDDWTPRAVVIVPCKGNEIGLLENLESIVDQDYPDFSVVLVVESEDDPAVGPIEELKLRSPVPIRLLIAGLSENTGQKVHNLRAAIERSQSKAEVVAFADSDARPRRDWLRNLVAPLKEPGVGCTTGYRWFFSPSGSVSGEMLSVWNASITSALGPDDKVNFCWGGSTAILSDTFRRLGIAAAWKNTISDDFVLTRCVRRNGLGIRFVPGCVLPSFQDPRFAGFFEFTTRQMKITRVYSPRLWRISLVSSLIFTSSMAAGVTLFAISRTGGRVATGAIMSVILLLGTGKSWLRLDALGAVLVDQSARLKRQRPIHMVLWPLTPLVFFLNDILALFSKRIDWRGVRYELVSSVETRVMRR